tara:strand:- start:1107 stop:1622 length:516 start_codon:yes stop_codon:yes gene_type:complete
MNNEVMSSIRKIQEGLSMLTSALPNCNPLAPGFLKEVVIANKLNHSVVLEKHLCDGYDKDGNQYEYLTCLEDGLNKEGKKLYRGYAIDCVFSSPPEFKEKSLQRITRNKLIYYAVFKEGTLEIIEMWEGLPKALEMFIDKQVTRRGINGKNTEHTIGITKNWVRENCKKII